MKILLIGDSPLAFLVAKVVDDTLAKNVHLDFHYISRENSIPYLPGLEVLGKLPALERRSVLRHGEVIIQQVKGVNLKERRVILERDVLNYDLLFLDQTPSYTLEELKAVAKSTQHLIAQVSSDRKKGESTEARIGFVGRNAESWQLALATLSLLRQQNLKSISVEVDMPPEETLSKFLEASGLHHQSNRRRAGFSVAAPKGPIKSESIRGLTLDINNRAIVGRELTPPHHQEAMIIDNEMRSLRLLWKPDLVMAKQIVKNMELILDKLPILPIDLIEPALQLSSDRETYLMIGKLTNRGLRAKAVSRLDRNFFNSLPARNL